MNRACTIDEISDIWRRQLGRPSIGENDNFFDLGGTPELAAKIFQQIGDLCGRVLPSVVIYQAPTIRSLASLLQQIQSTYCPPVLQIKNGVNPAIFLSHGKGADAMQMFHIAQHLNVSNSIYATQTPGIDGVTEPLNSVENMASVYIDAIQAVQPRGPYILIGYSFGGLVMMEVAHRLLAAGETIAFFAMIDTYPHRIHLRPAHHFPLFMRSVLRRLSLISHAFHKKFNRPSVQSSTDRVRERLYEAEFVAWRNYRPRFYPGKIFYLRASITKYFPKNVRAVWGPLVQELEVHDIPGDHNSLVEGQHELVADLLTGKLKQLIDCHCFA